MKNFITKCKQLIESYNKATDGFRNEIYPDYTEPFKNQIDFYGEQKALKKQLETTLCDSCGKYNDEAFQEQKLIAEE